jgi:sarcosine oxidase subunit alpha
VLFTNNDGAYRTALDLVDAGSSVAAIIDLRAEPRGELVQAARAKGIELLAGHAVTGTLGHKRIKAVKIMALNAAGDAVGGGARQMDCDALLVSGGWNPTVHLYSQSRGTLRFDEALASFVPSKPHEATLTAGAINGALRSSDCLAQGFEAGASAARAAGFEASPGTAPALTSAEPAEEPLRALWLVPSGKPLGQGGKHFVDHQNDVTAADVALANREGYRSVEHLKRYTTMGMGTDQGKTSNVNALAILADLRDAQIPEVGFTTFRAPYTPVTIGAFVGHEKGDLFDPIRRTPMHGWHEKAGALFENVGQWKRPWYYPKAGETMHDAVNREVKRGHRRRLNARQDRPARSRHRQAAQHGLHQRLGQARGRALPLRPDVRRGRHGVR